MIKKIFKGCLILVITFFVLITILLTVYFYSQKTKILDSESQVNTTWKEVYFLSSERLMFISGFGEQPHIPDSAFVGLQKIISQNMDVRELYADKCELEFVLEEYKLDSCYMQVVRDKSNLSQESFIYIHKVDSINTMLNSTIDVYNESVQYHNRLLWSVVTLRMVKKRGITAKKYFPIKYGRPNKNPVIQQQEISQRFAETERKRQQADTE